MCKGEVLTVKLRKGKVAGIDACANDAGIVAAAAMDQRGSLEKAISKARGAPATPEDLDKFKTAVTKVLTRHASAVLLDPEFGLPAVKVRAKGTGVLLAYEKTGYDTKDDSRLPDLLSTWSVPRLVEAGANAIKILLYYNPTHPAGINDVKKAFVERIGAECAGCDVPFFLETICYNDALGDAKGLEFAKAKPGYVTSYMKEFSDPRYGVDVLKVEVPVSMSFVEGTSTFAGTKAYTRKEAMRLFAESAAVAKVPFIYLSAGVTDEVFRETLELAAEAGTPFSGVLAAGRPGRTASPSMPRAATMRWWRGWRTVAWRTSRRSTRYC